LKSFGMESFKALRLNLSSTLLMPTFFIREY
jgi:hypothetical protein